MKIILVLGCALLPLVAECKDETKPAQFSAFPGAVPKSAPNAPGAKILVTEWLKVTVGAAGDVSVDKKQVTLTELSGEYARLKKTGGGIALIVSTLPQRPTPAQAEVIRKIIEAGLPMKMVANETELESATQPKALSEGGPNWKLGAFTMNGTNVPLGHVAIRPLPRNAPLNVPVVTILDDSAVASAGTRADKVLGPAGISTRIVKDGYSQHFSINVPLDKHQQATQLLKQDAEFQKYNVQFFELPERLKSRAQGAE